MPRETFWLAPQDRVKVYASLGALAGGLALVIAFIAVFAAFTYPTERVAASWYLAGDVDGFEVGKPVTFKDRKFHLVKREDGSFVALYWKSTHLGCTVPWRESFEFNGEIGWFRDPCSGSTWDENGVRVFGPAPRNLDRFPVEIRGGSVYVRPANQFLIRGCSSYDPHC